MQLILFDIDQTLLAAHGAGRRALERTFRRILGQTAGLAEVSFGGKTDLLIVREALTKGGISPNEQRRVLPQILRHYPKELARELTPTSSTPPTLLPGVRPLLETLAQRDDLLLGLLTGNLEAAAWLKLRVVGIDHFFTFGAFGDDGVERVDLPPVALERAWAGSGYRFRGDEVVIIGDTPRDIDAGRAFGFRTVAVATGPYDLAQLQAAGADLVLPSLAEWKRFVEFVERGVSP